MFQGQRYLSTGEIPTPQGNNHPVLVPYGVFATADIPIIIAAGTDKHWRDLCELLGDPQLAADPQFATGKDRTRNRDGVKERLEQLLATRSGVEWVDELRTAGIPVGPIYNYAQAFADPQVVHLDMVQHVVRPDGSYLPLLRGPLSVNGSPTIIRKPPPGLGQDTLAVLAGLGLTDEQVAGLVEAGVVRTSASTAGLPAAAGA